MPEYNLEEFWKGVQKLTPTRHFIERLKEKKIPIPSIDEVRRGQIFEIGIEFDEVLKVCYRVHTPKNDYCYVIRKGGVLVTAWRQHPKDSHSTLDVTKYWTE